MPNTDGWSENICEREVSQACRGVPDAFGGAHACHPQDSVNQKGRAVRRVEILRDHGVEKQLFIKIVIIEMVPVEIDGHQMGNKGVIVGDGRPGRRRHVEGGIVGELADGQHSTDTHAFGRWTGRQSCACLVGNLSGIVIEESEDLVKRRISSDELEQLARFIF